MSEITTGNEGKQRKQNVKSEAPTSYEVKSKGFTQTYETKEAALQQAEILKKNGIKKEETVDVKVLAQTGNEKPRVIHNVKIDESFYD